MNFKLIQSINTPYCADSVEWCPIAPYQHYFVCGTYELQKSDQSSETETKHQIRLGQLHLFSLTEKLNLDLNQTVDTSAILDIKWYQRLLDNKIVFASANADGKILLWNLITAPTCRVDIVAEHKLNSQDVLSLSIDWSTEAKICVSDSAGYLFVLHFNNGNLSLQHRFHTHNLEAWTVTFDKSNLLYSGADDSLLKITDLETGKSVSQLKEHTSGVTSIRFHNSQPHIFASGSYDETIKLWDTRNTSKSITTYVGSGGVWRIKWSPRGETILTASMYSGCFWYDYVRETNTIELKGELKEHESIAYGADICHLPTNEIIRRYCDETDYHNSVILTVTCSFYDKKLCLCAV